MAAVIRQSTSRTVKIGPYVDADGVALTGLTPAPTLSKNGGALAARSGGAISHDADGWYNCPLDATDTNTVGLLLIQDTDAAHMPVWHECVVVEEQIYDALFGSGAIAPATGTDLAAVAVDVLALPTAAEIWAAITTAAANKIADHVLRRSWATAAASGDGDTKSFRSLLGAVAKLVNRFAVVAGTATVYEADDTTPLGTQTATVDAAADPITALNTD